MNFTPIKTPAALRRLFPDLVWTIPGSEKILYLTFDDGPTPGITDWTLDVLKEYNAKATFFCVGEQVKSHPELYKRILNENHRIGNHSYNHLKGWKTSSSVYLENVKKASEYINSSLFRPPYGQITPNQIEIISNAGYKIVMWSILSVDWDQKISKEKCADNVIEKASTGDIVVFHDSVKAHKNMSFALPAILEKFSNDGFEFKRIPELIR